MNIDIDSASDRTPSKYDSQASFEVDLSPHPRPFNYPQNVVYPPPVTLTPDMSTRRSTRAASRQATPAVNGDIPSTPAPARRTARRAGNTPLPAVSLKPSTAYGTNTIAQPAAAAGPIISEQINDVLKNLLKPVANPDPDSPPSPAKSLSLYSTF
jgi:hypothetical protein